MSKEGFLNKVCSTLHYEIRYFPDKDTDYSFVEIYDPVSKASCSLRLPDEMTFETRIPDEAVSDLTTLFFNHVWPSRDEFDEIENVLKFVQLNFPDRSPFAKADRILTHIQSLCTCDGQFVSLHSFRKADDRWRCLFLTNLYELDFYLDYLISSDFLKVNGVATNKYDSIGLTVKGIDKVVKIQENLNSRACFVAMSFDEEMFEVYNAGIKPAIVASGFEPIIISEKKDIPSDTTINDAILSAIKKARFTISDFTKHKHGVYFEAGYALGRGQKVIYTCRVDEIDKAHFDTRNYPHIIWKDADDLKRQLIDKIEVFIKA